MSRKLIVNGNYICNNNNLKDLQGAPEYVGVISIVHKIN